MLMVIESRKCYLLLRTNNAVVPFQSIRQNENPTRDVSKCCLLRSPYREAIILNSLKKIPSSMNPKRFFPFYKPKNDTSLAPRIEAQLRICRVYMRGLDGSERNMDSIIDKVVFLDVGDNMIRRLPSIVHWTICIGEYRSGFRTRSLIIHQRSTISRMPRSGTFVAAGLGSVDRVY